MSLVGHSRVEGVEQVDTIVANRSDSYGFQGGDIAVFSFHWI